MPNGKLGDHPLTDILDYGHSEFGDPVDSLVKEIAAHPAFASVREEVSTLLWDLSPHWLNAVDGGREEALLQLQEIRKRLK